MGWGGVGSADNGLMYAKGMPVSPRPTSSPTRHIAWNARLIKSQSNLKKKNLLCWFVQFDLPSTDD